MRDPATPMTDQQLAARRKGVRRTAWAVGLLALAVYVVFLLSGVLAQ
jgi:hypothetical protein